MRPGRLRPPGAGARHLLRYAAHDRRARRRGRAGAPAGVRPRHDHGAAADPALRGSAAQLASMGQSRRSRPDAAAGVHRRGDQRERAGGGDAARGARPLRAPVPSRGGAHRARHRDPPPVRVRRVRLPRRLDDGLVRRGDGRADPGAGRGGAGALRPERRRRLDGGGGAGAPRDRRPPDVRVRGQRRAAPGRGGAGAAARRGAAAACRSSSPTPRRSSSTGWRA